MMTLEEFHNGLRLLRSIDASEIGNPGWWPEFRDNPYKFFMACQEDEARQIWAVMVLRGAVKFDAPNIRAAAQAAYDFLQDKSFTPDELTHECTRIVEMLDAALRVHGQALPCWEDIAVAICCGKHCDAANHAPDHDMDTEHYCQKYGCQTKENYKSANAVLDLLVHNATDTPHHREGS